MEGIGRLRYFSKWPHLKGDAAQLGYNDYTGTFKNDLFHGIGVQEWQNFVYEGEYKEGRRHGWSTVYFRNGLSNFDVFNMKHEEGKETFRQRVTDPSKALFGDGLSLQTKQARNQMFENWNRIMLAEVQSKLSAAIATRLLQEQPENDNPQDMQSSEADYIRNTFKNRGIMRPGYLSNR